ncbi:MAG: hypothetical protein HY713_13270 [candidate division NC10 bacterium]|nr:hypothetical protein [candidate division NC10 bacterium]
MGVGPLDDPAFRALVEQAKRLCPKHPALLAAYLSVIREKGRGIEERELQAILDEVAGGVPEAPGASR